MRAGSYSVLPGQVLQLGTAPRQSQQRPVSAGECEHESVTEPRLERSWDREDSRWGLAATLTVAVPDQGPELRAQNKQGKEQRGGLRCRDSGRSAGWTWSPGAGHCLLLRPFLSHSCL